MEEITRQQAISLSTQERSLSTGCGLAAAQLPASTEIELVALTQRRVAMDKYVMSIVRVLEERNQGRVSVQEGAATLGRN